MFKHPFSDGMTDDSMFKKVFFGTVRCLSGGVARSLRLFYILFIYTVISVTTVIGLYFQAFRR